MASRELLLLLLLPTIITDVEERREGSTIRASAATPRRRRTMCTLHAPCVGAVGGAAPGGGGKLEGGGEVVDDGEDARRAIGRATSMPRQWWWSSDLAGGAAGRTWEGSRTRIPLIPDWSWMGDEDGDFEQGLDHATSKEDGVHSVQGSSSSELAAWGGTSGCAGEGNSPEALDLGRKPSMGGAMHRIQVDAARIRREGRSGSSGGRAATTVGSKPRGAFFFSSALHVGRRTGAGNAARFSEERENREHVAGFLL